MNAISGRGCMSEFGMLLCGKVHLVYYSGMVGKATECWTPTIFLEGPFLGFLNVGIPANGRLEMIIRRC